MKRLILFSFALCLHAPQTVAQPDGSMHQAWTDLLQVHVRPTGWVSYKGFVQDSVKLNSYLHELSSNPPGSAWSREEELAYWINAYNAFTVKLIIDHYPVTSIKDSKKGVPFVNSVWDIKFFTVGNKRMDLNTIEHSILRKKFNEPRIHFSIVCASVSCPRLRNEAYVAADLERQLQEQAVEFINDESKNQIGNSEVRLSPIFSWFKKDFTKNMTLMEYIRSYSERKPGTSVKPGFMDYDWNLNGE